MKLSEFFKFYGYISTDAVPEIDISNISTHSGSIKKGGLFFAFMGEKRDGMDFLAEAKNNGAVAAVSLKRPANSALPVIIVEDMRLALSRWSAALYGFPADELNITGVTGTNGKTTITNLIYKILSSKRETGLIGTSGYRYGKITGKFRMTTPEPHELHYIFRKMAEAGIEDVVMEVSSHALVLMRVEDIKFNAAIFTNLTRDHLDFHRNYENYFNAKLKLFSLLKDDRSPAIINIDDKYGRRIAGHIGSKKAISYAIDRKADYRATVDNIGINGSRFKLKIGSGTGSEKNRDLDMKLIGKFNIYNVLAAIARAVEGGIDMEKACEIISKAEPVKGRLEIVEKNKKENRRVIIDYAHTPDALDNVLLTLKSMTVGRLICVFGCGGDRDRAKRPLMGKVAGIYADKVYLTSDNPRSEDPVKILLDIELGIRKTKAPYIVIPDREEAIKKALAESGPDDAVLIAGKGDEEFQIIGDEQIPFSDREIAGKYM
ncbi:MAG: UDP-N-acetylmuramoyl-L-alanyl-D-glutamate--2,6-diaminopimelate ligase [Elusimicrobia bacterium]|jgi:UDP-N-acetylmuramoyl-L-alanyl-D-glutamate--2,6-diaminopimelate ligase|nr:UDP-N-acetylmuramoyl-L-alanyl-D-glutamate--2,6-diaminopimelate ligase [Elusimicrobiota bacterium]